MDNYADRIDKVIEYMEENLSNKLNLEALAEVSNFSKFHFSRVFASIVGVTPYAFLTSRRLEKSVEYLTETNKSILEISMLCGFESASNFNYVFKKQYHCTPSEVRKSSEQNSNMSLHFGNKHEDIEGSSRYSESRNTNQFLRRIWDMNISIKELPDVEVGYVRHIGSYLDTYQAWGKLGEWAGKNNLFPPAQSFIGVSLDDPSISEEYACRYDACVTIPDGFNKLEDSEIQYKILPGGLYGLYSFYDTVDKLAIAYHAVYGQWLPNSDYEPDDRHCLEFCMNNPGDDPEGKAKIDLYIPIK